MFLAVVCLFVCFVGNWFLLVFGSRVMLSFCSLLSKYLESNIKLIIACKALNNVQCTGPEIVEMMRLRQQGIVEKTEDAMKQVPTNKHENVVNMFAILDSGYTLFDKGFNPGFNRNKYVIGTPIYAKMVDEVYSANRKLMREVDTLKEALDESKRQCATLQQSSLSTLSVTFTTNISFIREYSFLLL